MFSLPIFPSFGLLGHFLGTVLVFYNFGVVLKFHVKLCMAEPDYLGTFFLPPKWAKNRFFLIYWKFWSLIFIKFDLFVVFLHKSHIWEIFVTEIWPKMFSASQIAGFLNQPYLQNKSRR